MELRYTFEPMSNGEGWVIRFTGAVQHELMFPGGDDEARKFAASVPVPVRLITEFMDHIEDWLGEWMKEHPYADQ